MRARAFARLVAVAGALVVSTASAQSQAPGGGFGIDVDFGALERSKVGAWADYNVMVPNKAEESMVRYALVDRGSKTLSLEMDAASPKGEVDVRIDFTAPGPDAWTATGGKVKVGDKLVDLPAADVASAPPLTRGALPGALVGTEDIVTPVGKLSCKHYHRSFPIPGGTESLGVDLWMSDKVLPTGLAKSSMTGKGGSSVSMTIAGMGQGAQSRVK